jgi:hypothetical protein
LASCAEALASFPPAPPRALPLDTVWCAHLAHRQLPPHTLCQWLRASVCACAASHSSSCSGSYLQLRSACRTSAPFFLEVRHARTITRATLPGIRAKVLRGYVDRSMHSYPLLRFIKHALSRSTPLYADELFGGTGASGEAAPGLIASSGARLALTSGGGDVLRPAYGPRGSRVRCRHPRIRSHRKLSRNPPAAPAGTDLGPRKPAVRRAADNDCCQNADRDMCRWSACAARVRANELFAHKLRDEMVAADLADRIARGREGSILQCCGRAFLPPYR